MNALKQQLVTLLNKSEAHTDFSAALRDFPPAKRGVKPPGASHTAWQLLEHLRIAQWDILKFCHDPKHVSPSWPEGYWPATEAPPSEADWDKSIAQFESNAAELATSVADPAVDLLATLPHGEGQSLFREALLVLDHNAYHIGQLVLLRELLGVWRP